MHIDIISVCSCILKLIDNFFHLTNNNFSPMTIKESKRVVKSATGMHIFLWVSYRHHHSRNLMVCTIDQSKLKYVNKKVGRKEQNKNYFRKTVREIELNKSLENTFKASSMVGVLSLMKLLCKLI